MKRSQRRSVWKPSQLARIGRQQGCWQPGLGEKGQSMLEMTVGTVFLLIVVLILFEMGMLFYSYIAVLNASREGAVYASIYPTIQEGDPRYDRYASIVRAEAEAASNA